MLNPQKLKNGQEQYEEFYSDISNKKLIQYDYRHYNGELYSVVKKSLEECRIAKDEWVYSFRLRKEQ